MDLHEEMDVCLDRVMPACVHQRMFQQFDRQRVAQYGAGFVWDHFIEEMFADESDDIRGAVVVLWKPSVRITNLDLVREHFWELGAIGHCKAFVRWVTLEQPFGYYATVPVADTFHRGERIVPAWSHPEPHEPNHCPGRPTHLGVVKEMCLEPEHVWTFVGFRV